MKLAVRGVDQDALVDIFAEFWYGCVLVVDDLDLVLLLGLQCRKPVLYGLK